MLEDQQDDVSILVASVYYFMLEGIIEHYS